MLLDECYAASNIATYPEVDHSLKRRGLGALYLFNYQYIR
jgi:hypothetical protein